MGILSFGVGGISNGVTLDATLSLLDVMNSYISHDGRCGSIISTF